jgi:membrane protein YdbS with pleckstrin-like domain
MRIELPDTQWRRVSPKYIVVDLVGTFITAVIVVGAASAAPFFSGVVWLWTIPGVLAILFLIGLALTPRRVRALGYQLRTDDLLFRKGLMFQRFVSVPYGRMQLVDINRGPVARAVGLSELKFVTAAASTAVTIPGLPEEEAEALRDQLVELAETRRAGL